MPSDPGTTLALAALARPIAEFRALVEDALAQADAFLAAQTAGSDQRITTAGAQLGRFAEGRLDPARFAALFPPARHSDPAALEALGHARDVLRAIAARGDATFVIDLPPGSRVAAVVRQALSETGRAFGAMILIDLVRGGRYTAGAHQRLLEPREFEAWSKAERRAAPPLVVTLDGADAHAGGLADFVDGHQKFVLVVRGACAPAPLVRCLTPGTFVLQTTDGSGLDQLVAFQGPAIAAVVPEGSAVFLHDPAGGRESWQRLAIRTTGELPRHAIGGVSVWQMGEEIRMLADLARTPFAIPGPGAGASPAVGATDAADRIATWLLGEAGLAGT